MAKIEVGMLVEIIDHRTFIQNRDFIGHRGKVLGLGPGVAALGGPCWIVEGANRTGLGWPEYHLRPIDEPRKNQDIEETREKGCGDWDLMPWRPRVKEEV